MDTKQTIKQFVELQNAKKKLFTPGPASLLPENILGLRPCFGRGDQDYAAVEARVLDLLKRMSGHQNIVRMQGSASMALEIAALNFLYGNVLVISSGYYSDRLYWLAESAKRRTNQVKKVVQVNWQELEKIEGKFDWVVACYTETSCGLKLQIEHLKKTAEKFKARLMVDATASIGLEIRHELADVIAYSSCKGLFGLTGGAFIAYHEPHTIEVDSFYLNIVNHIEKKMTGPYHAITSLLYVLESHGQFVAAVQKNKEVFLNRMKKYLTVPKQNQPLLCTHVSCSISTQDKSDILYEPRASRGGSVVCHLGEIHLADRASGKIIDVLEVQK